jgi:hypothetical protein
LSVGGKQPAPYTMSIDDEVVLCRVINTAEYCSDVVPKLEAQIKQKVGVLSEKDIDFAPQIELFTDVVANTIGLLVRGVRSHTHAALREMRKTPWSTVEAVGDDSGYVSSIRSTIAHIIPRLRLSLSPIWFKNFCARFATEFLDAYLDIIMKQKKICPVGADQLLLDTNCLKTVFTSLHHTGFGQKDERKNEFPIPGPYSNLVGVRFRHLETVLKLVRTPEEQFEEMFAIMMPEGTPAEQKAIYELKHNPSVMATTANAVGTAASAVGDISVATTRVAVGATTRAIEVMGTTTLGASSKVMGSSSKALEAIGSSSSKALGTSTKAFEALGSSSSKAFGAMGSSSKAFGGGLLAGTAKMTSTFKSVAKRASALNVDQQGMDGSGSSR